MLNVNNTENVLKMSDTYADVLKMSDTYADVLKMSDTYGKLTIIYL